MLNEAQEKFDPKKDQSVLRCGSVDSLQLENPDEERKKWPGGKVEN